MNAVIVRATFQVIAIGKIAARTVRINNVVWLCARLVGDDAWESGHDAWELRRQAGPNAYGLPPDEHTVWTLNGAPQQLPPSTDELPPNTQNALINATRAMLAWVS